MNPLDYFHKLNFDFDSDCDFLIDMLAQHDIMNPSNRAWEWFHIGSRNAMKLRVVDEFVEKAKIRVHNAKFFVLAPNSISTVHTDGVNRSCALNLPLLTPDTATMSWFDEPFTNRVIVTDAMDTDDHNFFDGGRCPLPLIDGKPQEFSRSTLSDASEQSKDFTKDWIPAITTEVKEPIFVNIGKWHQVRNPTPHHRVVLSVRFLGNPNYNDVLSRLL